MKTYLIAFYRKTNSIWWVNGGILTFTQNEYIVKNFFKTVARFPKNKTIANKIPDNMLYRGICLADGTKSIHIYFFSKTANKVYKLLGIY